MSGAKETRAPCVPYFTVLSPASVVNKNVHAYTFSRPTLRDVHDFSLKRGVRARVLAPLNEIQEQR